MAVRLSAPGGAVEIRRLAVDWVEVGTSHLVDVEVVADGTAATTAKLACSQSGWLEVSDDAGATWSAVPTDPRAGVELGPLAEDERRSITLRLTVPGGTSVRTQIVELYVGLGT